MRQGTAYNGKVGTMKRNEIIKQIEENKPQPLGRDKIKKCFAIIFAIGKRTISGKELARLVNLTDVQLRHHILYIRREMIKFQNPTGKFFIVADKNGYRLTNDKKALKKYLTALLTRYSNIYNQILQLRLILLND